MNRDSRYLKNITLEDKVYNTIIDNNLIENNDKIVLGVSGGPDSMCMFNVLLSLKDVLKKENDIVYDLIVAHINHGIRQESDGEALYVKEFCEKNNIKFYYLKTNIKELSKENKMSEEMCGRQVRYEFFDKILKKENATKIAVAHNADDNVETIILNLSRGTGIKGLTGISYKNLNIIRPILDIYKEEVLKYCSEKNLEPKIDKTNFEEIYLRNKIRLSVIPNLKQNLGENFCASVLKTREILTKEEEFLSDYTNKIINSAIIENNNESITFNFSYIANEHEAICYRCIREIIKMCTGDLIQVSMIHISDIYKMLKQNIKSKTFIIGNKFSIKIINKNIAIINKLS